jgi:uncharacterized OB-fold protein
MFHKCKYGKVEDGYQYCLKCGKAILAPQPKCQHKWIREEEIEITSNGWVLGKLYIDCCKKCGELNKTYIKP